MQWCLKPLIKGGFKAAIEGGKRFHSKSMDASNATAARARWHKAIHRLIFCIQRDITIAWLLCSVLLQIAVAKYTAVIKHSKSCSLQRGEQCALWIWYIRRCILMLHYSNQIFLHTYNRAVDTPTRVRGNRSTFPATDGFLPISKPGILHTHRCCTKKQYAAIYDKFIKGAPLSKPSPLTDVVGFGSVTSVVSKVTIPRFIYWYSKVMFYFISDV